MLSASIQAEFIYIRSSANAMAEDLAKQGVDRTSPFVVFQCNLYRGFSILPFLGGPSFWPGGLVLISFLVN